METRNEKIINYYRQGGKISSPGKYKNEIPKTKNVSKLCEFTSNIILIDFLVNNKMIDVPANHKDDVNIRKVEEKLNILLARSKYLPVGARKNEEKLIGNCRDTSLLLCSILRQNGIAARVRSGFATFFSPKKKFDHWLCEYWDEERSRWIKVDSWMFQIHLHKDVLTPFYKAGLTKLAYNPLDVEDKHFITGGEAWLKCENQDDDPNTFGTYEKEMRGMWFIRDNMLRDLLCLNKVEVLPWDCKGLMSGDRGKITNQDRDTLNYLAKLLSNIIDNFDKIKEFYQKNESLHF